jgi:WD40 repeat protein
MKYVEVTRQSFQGITFTPDGRYLVSLHPSGIVRFWSFPDFVHQMAVRLQVIPGGGPLTLLGQLLLTPDGLFDLGEAWAMLASASSGGKALAVARRVELEGFGGDSILAGSASRSLVIGVGWPHYPRYPRPITAWQLDGKQSIAIAFSVAGDAPWISLAISPDGQFLAGGGYDCVTLLEIDRLQQYEKGLQPRTLPRRFSAQRLCFSPDSRFLVVGAGRSAWLWDLSGQRNPVRFPAFRQYVECLAFHPGGRQFAAGSRDGEVRTYETERAKEVLRLDLAIGAVRGLAFAPDGMTALAAGQDRRLAVWDVD